MLSQWKSFLTELNIDLFWNIIIGLTCVLQFYQRLELQVVTSISHSRYKRHAEVGKLITRVVGMMCKTCIFPKVMHPRLVPRKHYFIETIPHRCFGLSLLLKPLVNVTVTKIYFSLGATELSPDHILTDNGWSMFKQWTVKDCELEIWKQFY